MEYISFSYNYCPRNVELESRQFNDAMVYYNEQMVTYQEELVQYNLKKADYDEWLRTEKIKELEASLESLKKK